MNKNDKIRIGIPRALLYFHYGFIWEAFFEKLGCEITVSPESNKNILEEGLKNSVDESCLSVKIFIGHVKTLLNCTDYILIPRIASFGKNECACTKFYSLYDIINNTFDEIKIIEYEVDVNKKKYEIFGFLKMGVFLTKNPFLTLYSYWYAKREQWRIEKKNLKLHEYNLNNKKGPTIIIVAHPYITFDRLMGKPIVDFLEKLEVNILFASHSHKNRGRKYSKKICHDLHWKYSKEYIGSIELHRKKIDGIIFLVSFPCGPDSLVVDLCQNRIQEIPIATIVLDELYGEAGIKTRLESFVDILRMRRSKK